LHHSNVGDSPTLTVPKTPIQEQVIYNDAISWPCAGSTWQTKKKKGNPIKVNKVCWGEAKQSTRERKP